MLSVRCGTDEMALSPLTHIYFRSVFLLETQIKDYIIALLKQVLTDFMVFGETSIGLIEAEDFASRLLYNLNILHEKMVQGRKWYFLNQHTSRNNLAWVWDLVPSAQNSLK